MPNTVPQHILVDFLRSLAYMLNYDQNPESYEQDEQAGDIPWVVLRGSILLQHWFGPMARPAADVDLESFPSGRFSQDLSETATPAFGFYGEFVSPIDYAKAHCRYSGELFHYGQKEWKTRAEFFDAEPTDGGTSLWTYGTPGERYFAGWRYAGEQGVLQIDIAQPGRYEFKDLHITKETLELPGFDPFQIQCYSQEAMLAAKLSWVLRGLSRRSDAQGQGFLPTWNGEFKDVFDLHLLLTNGVLSGRHFQKSLLGFCKSDDINWDSLDVLLSFRDEAHADMEFPTWPEFQWTHSKQVAGRTPQSMLREIAHHLESLLGDFHLPAELDFIRAALESSDPTESYLIYSDYLEERGDSRGDFLRKLAEWKKSGSNLPDPELLQLTQSVSAAWLQRLSGSTANYRAWTEIPA